MSNRLSRPKPRPGLAKPLDPERKKLLCVDCVHHSLIDVSESASLAHACDADGLFDPVDGSPRFYACSWARKHSDICGPYATKFEPKDTFPKEAA